MKLRQIREAQKRKNKNNISQMRERLCRLTYLYADGPAYSPDLNPIEMAFSKLKARLRRIGARTFDQLIDAIGEICDIFTPEECRNFFHAAGYAS